MNYKKNVTFFMFITFFLLQSNYGIWGNFSYQWKRVKNFFKYGTNTGLRLRANYRDALNLGSSDNIKDAKKNFNNYIQKKKDAMAYSSEERPYAEKDINKLYHTSDNDEEKNIYHKLVSKSQELTSTEKSLLEAHGYTNDHLKALDENPKGEFSMSGNLEDLSNTLNELQTERKSLSSMNTDISFDSQNIEEKPKSLSEMFLQDAA